MRWGCEKLGEGEFTLNVQQVKKNDNGYRGKEVHRQRERARKTALVGSIHLGPKRKVH